MNCWTMHEVVWSPFEKCCGTEGCISVIVITTAKGLLIDCWTFGRDCRVCFRLSMSKGTDKCRSKVWLFLNEGGSGEANPDMTESHLRLRRFACMTD